MKFKSSEIVYFKYPSRYTRSKDEKTVEAILLIHSMVKISSSSYSKLDGSYSVKVLKNIRGSIINMSNAYYSLYAPDEKDVYLFDSLFIDTYCRKLTSTERVLYGNN